MIKPELYEKTVSILVDAYFNDTLQHGSCYACAVGNMVAANMNLKIVIDRNEDSIYWTDFTGAKLPYPSLEGWGAVFCTSLFEGQTICPDKYKDEAKAQIDSTGYTYNELARIEYAFERAKLASTVDEYMFNGLMAVIDCLDKIHENNDTSVTAETKQRFNKTQLA